MLFDVFYVQYSAQTGEAEKRIDDFGKKAERIADDVSSTMDDAMDQLGDGAKKAGDRIDGTSESARKLNKNLQGMKVIAEGVENAFGKIKSVQKVMADVTSIGAMVRSGNITGAYAAVSALRAARKAAPGSPGGDGGAGVPPIPPGGAGAAGGGMFRAMAAAGGPVALAVAGLITSVAASVGLAIRAGHKHAEAAKQFYGGTQQAAWNAGMSEKNLLTHQIAGENLGISRESTQAGLAGLNERIKQVALHRAQPTGGIDMKTGMDTDPLSRLLRKRGISIQKGKHLESMNKIWQVIVEDLRTAAEQKGTNYALARATQQYGLDFDQASKIINATSAQIREASKDIEKLALMEWALAQSTKKLTVEQSSLQGESDKTQKMMSAKVVPAMVEWTKSTTKWEKSMRPAYEKLAEIEAALIRLASYSLDKLSQFIDWMGEVIDLASNVHSVVKDSVMAPVNYVGSLVSDAWNGNFSGMMDRAKGAALDPIAESRLKTEASGVRLFGAQNTEYGQGVLKREAQQNTYELTNKANELKSEGKYSEKDIEQGLTKAVANGWDIGTLETYLQQIASNQKEGMEANDAQFQTQKEQLNQMILNTSVGLEQAIALWAGGVGRQGGLGSNENGMQGQSRADFEKRSRAIMFTGDRQVMQMASESAAKAQKMAGAAKIKESGASQVNNPSLKIDTLTVEVSGVQSPESLGEQIGSRAGAMLGSMYKEVANARDSVFKA